MNGAPRAADPPRRLSTHEPNRVVALLVEAWALPAAEVVARLADLHHVVDRFIARDAFVLAPPLIVGQERHPVWHAIHAYLHSVGREGPERDLAWSDVGDLDWLHEVLGLPLTTLEDYLVIGWTELLGAMLDLWRLPDQAAEVEFQRLEAWLDTYHTKGGQFRRYVVTPVGRERAIEDWLEADLDRLRQFGYPVSLDSDGNSLVGRQVRLTDQSIADLVVCVTEDTASMKAGDYVVIELKATAVNSLALDQLMRYVHILRTRKGAHRVHGLLIADGRSLNLRRSLDEQGLGYISLADLGYRDHLRAHPETARECDQTRETVAYPTTLSSR